MQVFGGEQQGQREAVRLGALALKSQGFSSSWTTLNEVYIQSLFPF